MSTYKAATCVEIGKALEIQDRAIPTDIKPNQVHINTHASVVNFADMERCRGQRDDAPEVPFVPGAVAAGVVLTVGSDVDNVKVGDRVVALNYGKLGGMAEQVVVNAKRVFPIPENVSFSKAAGSVVAYSAAIAALEKKARVQKGDFVLVSGAAGATGLAIIDAAKSMYGCQVIAVCRGQRKHDFLLERGFDRVIDSTQVNLVDTVMEMTGGEGVPVAIDVVGGDVLLDSLKCLSTDGTVVIVGFSSGNVPAIPADVIKQRSLTVMGLNWKTVDSLPIILQAVSEGKLDPYICKEFELDQVNQAYQMVFDKKSLGKVIVCMRKDE
ncbi:small nuclear ribonucleoprotein f [Plakobranchus ocellatus]|uniref:Small nuclear ribonucleoprotein f n=1 Tax=Plakobranchus ocellatus TaxID=259542 RepID=A0AAV4DJS9_9GAST|nr:small nuclear ribonucleoprotein f [Plakobranchus ocellatus]